jgi:hypothetical protein
MRKSDHRSLQTIRQLKKINSFQRLIMHLPQQKNQPPIDLPMGNDGRPRSNLP